MSASNSNSAARDALARLREGNQRFVASIQSGQPLLGPTKPIELGQPQNPVAIILGCSDARVPAELVFDQGLGDLFVIRVAGNVVAPSQVGSVEFAASRFSTPLVVVLGHSGCGAIVATIEALQQPSGSGSSRNLHSIVNRVKPSVEGLLATELRHDMHQLVHHAVRANVRASVNQLRHGSELLEQLIQQGSLAVVGAEYSLETGAVEFLDELDGS